MTDKTMTKTFSPTTLWVRGDGDTSQRRGSIMWRDDDGVHQADLFVAYSTDTRFVLSEFDSERTVPAMLAAHTPTHADGWDYAVWTMAASPAPTAMELAELVAGRDTLLGEPSDPWHVERAARAAVLAPVDKRPEPARPDTPEPAVEKNVSGDRREEAVEPVQMSGGRVYHPRPVGDSTDVALLRAARGRLFTRISGPAGTGKSTLAEAAFGDELIKVSSHSYLTVDDLVGTYLPDGEDSYTWVDGPLMRAMKEGRVLLVDDMTRAPSGTLNALLSPADDSRTLVVDGRPDLPNVKAAEGFHMIATYNETGVDVRPLDPAVLRRFPLAIEATTDFDVVSKLGVDRKLVKVGKILAAEDRRSTDAGLDPVWIPETDHLLKAQVALEDLGEQVAAAMLISAAPTADDAEAAAEAVRTVFGDSAGPLVQRSGQ